MKAAAGTGIGVAAQDVFWEEEGAYTGEVSPGHAGRRWGWWPPSSAIPSGVSYFGETDDWVAMKMRAALDHGLLPIMCVGETEPGARSRD